MALDIELYRRIIYAPAAGHSQTPRRISVIDIHPINNHPEGATPTLLFVHARITLSIMRQCHAMALPVARLRLLKSGQTMHVIAPDLRGHGQ